MKSVILDKFPNYRLFADGRIEKLSPMARKGGKYISHGLCRDGYIRVSLMHKNKSKTFSLHRLVALHFVPGRTPKRNCVNHINGTKHDCNWKNLEWCTQSENCRHAYLTGLSKKKGKVSVGEIKTIRFSKELNCKLAIRYKVSATAIAKIKKRKSYAWVS